MVQTPVRRKINLLAARWDASSANKRNEKKKKNVLG